MGVTRFPARAEGLADRMTGFIAHLRLNGMKLGPGETADALVVLGAVNATDPAEARLALKSLIVPDAEGWRHFDELFDAYWYNGGKTRTGTANAHVRVQSARPRLWQGHLDAPGGGGDGDGESTPGQGEGEAEGIDGRLIATRTDNLHKRDLRELMDEDSRHAAERAALDLARAIRDRRSRRRRQARRGAALDLRRTLRASLARGGEPIDLFRKQRPDRPMRIVALCDVSGSMQPYARVFLAFVKGLIDADTTADAYLFHTRLMRVTGALRDHDTLRAAGRLSLMAEGFGGGTDIGASLTAFADTCASRALTRRTVVLILSDGYCTGAPDNLARALSRIRRKAGRIVWLNPLLGWQDYAPIAAAMAAALPHLDAHLPANTIDALAALEPEFARL
ncbi:vWA domain-containing protein [Antarcticimicrobium luteum]|uniref:VWA domain-containing protein n=1 Tax=Antarcticimicrobium luteum TaxID=2547397 RepID=A0A4R5UQG7_9RHOB|nr:VWA domain-containing protein [Antarcticimicrobium luteum]TDK41121.1 VWA domain-containing protein [Antarcticimicrobium luteum]